MHPIVWSPHPYIPTCGWNLWFSCRAAEGVTEECILRVLLLTLHPEIFKMLDHPYSPHTIDQFAPITTHQLEVYNSYFNVPCTLGINALAQTDWKENNNFVNPPFALTPRILDKVIAEKAWATLIAPKWPAQPWFQRLLRLLQSPPVHIPNFPRTMIRRISRPEPMKNHNWEIYA